MKFPEIENLYYKHLATCSYTKNTLERYRKKFNCFRNYVLKTFNTNEYKPEYAESFLEIKKDVAHDRYERIINMINDIVSGNKIPDKYDNKVYILKRDLTPYYQNILDNYLKRLKLATKTLHTKRDTLTNFFTHLESLKIFNITNINVDIINAYIVDYKLKRNVKDSTINRMLYEIRSFVSYLYETKIVENNISNKILIKKFCKQAKIPSTISIPEAQKILSVIDRNSLIGKRDHAMLSIALFLGIRIGDIKNLKFSDIDFENKTINIIQNKTQKPLKTFIPDYVGDTLTDYILNGRPKTTIDYIFVSNHPPFGKLSELNYLNYPLKKYARKAGIDINNRKLGFHTLRHTFAVELLKSGTGLPIISQALGHTSYDTTTIYLKADIETLRECVLPLDGIDYE